LDSISAEKERLDKREERIEEEMLAKIRGVPVEDVVITRHYGHGGDPEVVRAIQCRQKVHEDELLAEHPLGREILKLRNEKEDLLDTVWLAPGTTQIKELWTKVAELLDEKKGRLESAPLAIAPVTDQ
jgi:hypothetical protein